MQTSSLLLNEGKTLHPHFGPFCNTLLIQKLYYLSYNLYLKINIVDLSKGNTHDVTMGVE